MHVVDLRDFYASALGRLTCSTLTARLARLGAAKPGQIVMGLGYAPPYLPALAPEGAAGLAFMPAKQGVVHWPEDSKNLSTLVDGCALPLVESAIDMAFLVHSLEFADAPEEMLEEVWRVLAPQGRLILVIPNRRGLWAASERTPFGHGRPFSRSQISSLLKDAKYSITRWDSALYFPPLSGRVSLAMAKSLESAGRIVAGTFSGLTIVEATKQVYAFSSGKRARKLVPRFRPVLLPAPQGIRRSGAKMIPKPGNSGL
jgi:SAM-dependent methyltransferase